MPTLMAELVFPSATDTLEDESINEKSAVGVDGG
jgi:hypothetical protein